MSSMPPELKKRLATGLAGAAVLIALIVFVGWYGVFFLVAVISIGMLWEYTEIALGSSHHTEKRYLLLSLGLFTSLVGLGVRGSDGFLLMASFLVLFTYFLLTADRYKDDLKLAMHFKELGVCFFGLIYLIFMPTYFLRIFEAHNGVSWAILFLLIVWAGDSVAYFVGRQFGRTKLYPRISPKKTVEGAIGGLVGGIFVACAYKLVLFKEISLGSAIFTSVFVGIVAQLGDLCESFLKRAFDTKDSGTLLPGHGGFLDRFDGVIFSLPVMYACVQLLG